MTDTGRPEGPHAGMLAGMLAGCMLVALGCSSPAPSSPAPPPPSKEGELECTEIGCGPAFILDFDRSQPWVRGTYQIEVTVDGESFTCERAMPLLCDSPPACPRPDVQLIEIGCQLAPGEQALGGLQFIADPPAEVAVRLLENDVQIASGSYEPRYETLRPNGPECPPACSQAPNGVLVVGPSTDAE